MLLVKESIAGREPARADILQLPHQVIDVVVQFAVNGHHRHINNIWFGDNAVTTGQAPPH
jgi:hypothetical protein